MKKTLLLSFIFMFSLLVVACNDDDDDDNGGPATQNPPENTDPTFTAIISGDITDTIFFTVPGGIFTDQTVLGSYVGVANLMTINVMELPTGYQLLLVGNRDSFGTGEFVAEGVGGFGAYNDTDLGRAYTATACTITLESTELVQDLVQATYNANGSFSMELEDASTPPSTIEINGTFENMTLSVNE